MLSSFRAQGSLVSVVAVAVSVGGASFGAAIGCSAPAVLPSLLAAEQAERSGDHQAALRSYDAAIRECPAISSPRIRRRDCAAAHLHRAELLVTLGQRVDAIGWLRSDRGCTPWRPSHHR